MIERRDVMPINFLKKERFTGSYKGMRYRMEKAEREAKEEEAADGGGKETVLRVTWWPEPYAFSATPDEQKTWKEFPFTEDGIVSGVEWLNEQYDA